MPAMTPSVLMGLDGKKSCDDSRDSSVNKSRALQVKEST